jgi:uncharacterized protein
MSIKPNIITEQNAIEILKSCGCSQNVINHCINVCKVSNIIASSLIEKGIIIDLYIVKIGALLHDIGRSKTHSVSHGYIGGSILEENGISKKIVNIAERHVGGGISKMEAEELRFPNKQYIPETLEEKVVCFSDKIVGLGTIMPLKKTIEHLIKELGEQNNAVQRIIELKNEIASLLDDDPEELVKRRF